MVVSQPASWWLLCGLCLIAALAQAAPEPAPRSDEADTDFLDFLGSWQNEDGRWVDPFQVAEDLPPGRLPASKTKTPGLGAGARRADRSSKGAETIPTPEQSREPMRTQTGP